MAEGFKSNQISHDRHLSRTRDTSAYVIYSLSQVIERQKSWRALLKYPFERVKTSNLLRQFLLTTSATYFTVEYQLEHLLEISKDSLL